MNPIDRAGDTARQVGSYLGNIGQNIRDVGTAVGTNVQLGRFAGITGPKDPRNIAGEKNMMTQIKEVGGAVLGKPGTRSDQYSKATGYVSGSKLNK